MKKLFVLSFAFFGAGFFSQVRPNEYFKVIKNFSMATIDGDFNKKFDRRLVESSACDADLSPKLNGKISVSELSSNDAVQLAIYAEALFSNKERERFAKQFFPLFYLVDYLVPGYRSLSGFDGNRFYSSFIKAFFGHKTFRLDIEELKSDFFRCEISKNKLAKALNMCCEGFLESSQGDKMTLLGGVFRKMDEFRSLLDLGQPLVDRQSWKFYVERALVFFESLIMDDRLDAGLCPKIKEIFSSRVDAVARSQIRPAQEP